MAKGAGSTLQPRRVRNVKERNEGRGSFITLKPGDQFLGYALFVADPELDDNKGYYEYFEHYTPATGYMPCSGDGCPLCDEGDQANTRAKSVWLMVTNDNTDPDSGKIKVFNLNWSTIQEFSEDGADALGSLYRVKALEKKGSFSIRPKTDKLTKTQLKNLLKREDFPDLEKTVVRALRRGLEEMDVSAAMEEEDEDDNAAEAAEEKKQTGKSTARKGTAKEEEPEEEETPEAFDPEEADEFVGNVTVVKVTKKDNILRVSYGDDEGEFDLYGTDEIDLTTYKKKDELHVEAEKDSDGDFVVSSVGDAEEVEESGGGTAPDEIEDEKVTIVSVNTEEDTLTVEMEDGTQFELFFVDEGTDENDNDWEKFDLDDYEDGQEVVISAARDSDGDMLASAFPQAEKKGKKAGKGGKGRKSSK